MSAISRVFSRLGASVKAHKWIWTGCTVAVVAVGGAAVVYFGGFLGPSGHAICKVAVERARDYGTLPSGATQDGSAKSTDVKGRKSCIADVSGEKYTITADLKCKDLKNHECLPLYSVERSDGLSLYQVRAVPNDADEAAPVAGAAPSEAAAGAPAQAAVPAQSGNGGEIDADVEVAQPAPASAGGQ